MSLPRIKINHVSQDELNKLSNRQRLALYMGVPKDLLDYTDDEYLTEDSFRTYDFRLSAFEDNGSKKFNYPPLEQFKRVHALVHGDLKDKFIVINSYPFLFTTPREGHRQELYMHILGCIANRMSKRDLSMNLDLAFVGTNEIPYGQDLQLRDEQIIVWGPLHDKTTDYRLQETIQFIYNFRSTTKIILTSVNKLPLLFAKLRLDPKYPTEIFDIRTANEKPGKEAPEKKSGKPPKASRVAAVPRVLNV